MTEEEQFSRGMVVVAHADDAEFGCSGTVAKLTAEGWEMVYVLCTDGSKGSSDREITGEELAQTRRQEQIEAGKVLGLKDVAFLDYPDSMLEPTLDVRRDIAREIRRHRPDIVLCQYPLRTLDGAWGVGHPDHLAAGEATLSAIFPTARDHMTFPELLEEGFEPHIVSEAWIMGHPEPDHYVDVTGHLETAAKALAAHSSQTNGTPADELLERMGEWRRRTGEGRGMQHAEAYKRITFRRRRPREDKTDTKE
jgi:LmbE family N-acetylglucosaminyl deacetylase